MPLTSAGNQEHNLTDEDFRMATMPPLPPLSPDAEPNGPMPISMPMPITASDEQSALEHNVSMSLMWRSRALQASTPLTSYRIQLPAIDEEPHQLQRQGAGTPTMGRMPDLIQELQEDAIGTASIILPPLPRDWASIFRPREAIPNYAEQQPGRRRRRRRRAAGGGATAEAEGAAATARTTLEHIEATEPPSNDEIAIEFLSNLFQTAWEQAEPPTLMQQATAAVVEDVPEATQMRESVVALPMMSPNELPERPIVTSIEYIYQPGMAAQYHLAAQPAANTTPIEFQNSPIITTTNVGQPSSMEEEEQLLQQTQQQQQQIIDQSNRLSEDLSYIVQHKHMLRLMVDHQKQLSDEQQQEDRQRNCCNHDNTEDDSNNSNTEESNTQFRSMPAQYTYDPQIILNMPEMKRRVIHDLMAAIIMQPTVDMRSNDFIKTRMEAAIAFRVLLDLKAANIVSLSADARFASLL
ncbi:sister chromatid cohesion protein solo [Drosophila grimshawi]|uniref:sister chromatid cohesion protein solo n=1 Tax=Drosophila grimshawi TaxID=7222 RepID=UPI0013EF1969|nr:sister chromatid cohesion protein solo [Drosophila grimshawi]